VLLLDLTLPHDGGLQVLETLHAAPLLRPSVVMVLAPRQADTLVRVALAAGADDYLVMPCAMDDLNLRVQLWRRGTAPVPHTTPLRVHSLGRFYVEGGDKIRLHQGGRTSKAGTLFKYLLSHRERTVLTGEVLDLLWPAMPRDVAATLCLRLAPDDWWDVEEYTAQLAQGMKWRQAGETRRAFAAYAAALACYRGDYMEEDAEADWAQPLREQLREEWLEALNTMAALHQELGEARQQEAVLRALLRAAPYREHTYRALMSLLVGQGRSAEALILYRQLAHLLEVKLQTKPDPKTQALAARIREAACLE
jgi:DNA-binding SARP family transcriptional activator